MARDPKGSIDYISLLVEKLKTVDPYKIILFGSQAYGKPTEDSDIDLIVVLKTEEMPGSFSKKNENYLTVSRVIRDICKLVSVDLIVYTKQEFVRFIELGSNFSKMVIKEGQELL